MLCKYLVFKNIVMRGKEQGNNEVTLGTNSYAIFP
jgi:hypothetical protein